MAEYLAPGAYIERADASAPAIAGVRTDVACFIGIATRGPLDTPVPVESFRQFQSHFGEFTGAGYLAYTVRAFFENGGRRCWVIRVASKATGGAAAAEYRVADSGGQLQWRLRASSPGVWGNGLRIRLVPEFRAQARATAIHAHYAEVTSVAGFQRGSLLRLAQGTSLTWRVVSQVDARAKRLYWLHPNAGEGLVYDRAWSDFDAGADLHIAELSYALVVSHNQRLLHHSRDLALIPEHPRYAPRVLREPVYPLRLEPGQGLPVPPPPVIIESLYAALSDIPAPLASDGQEQALRGGADGLALLRVEDFIGAPFDPLDSDEVRAQNNRGLQASQAVDELALLAIPDILIQPKLPPEYLPVTRPPRDPCRPCPPPPEARAEAHQPGLGFELPPLFSETEIYQVQAALVSHCELRGDRFAVLDAPYTAARPDEFGLNALQAWRARFETTYAALYYAWALVVDPLDEALVRPIPACGHVLGQMAAQDLEIGVHKAPANRLLNWVQDVSKRIDQGEHEILNPLGINVLRDQAGRGLRVMGARTLSSDPDWRFVNVRRLLIMIRKALDIATQWAAFEPNDHRTRSKLLLSINSFLGALWQRGMLSGDQAAAAYFIKCDADNNPPEERAQGRLNVQIGVAPSQPFEFVILRLGRQGNELEILEHSQLARAA